MAINQIPRDFNRVNQLDLIQDPQTSNIIDVSDVSREVVRPSVEKIFGKDAEFKVKRDDNIDSPTFTSDEQGRAVLNLNRKHILDLYSNKKQQSALLPKIHLGLLEHMVDNSGHEISFSDFRQLLSNSNIKKIKITKNGDSFHIDKTKDPSILHIKGKEGLHDFLKKHSSFIKDNDYTRKNDLEKFTRGRQAHKISEAQSPHVDKLFSTIENILRDKHLYHSSEFKALGKTIQDKIDRIFQHFSKIRKSTGEERQKLITHLKTFMDHKASDQSLLNVLKQMSTQ